MQGENTIGCREVGMAAGGAASGVGILGMGAVGGAIAPVYSLVVAAICTCGYVPLPWGAATSALTMGVGAAAGAGAVCLGGTAVGAYSLYKNYQEQRANASNSQLLLAKAPEQEEMGSAPAH